MKIATAQILSEKGNIIANVQRHTEFVRHAIIHGADIILFPELSLTGYERVQAHEYATTQDDERLDVLQALSNESNITIAAGLPTIGDKGIRISMVIFQPGNKRSTYSKQLLYSDEKTFFVPGEHQEIITVKDGNLAPAICYESMQMPHADNAAALGAQIYLSSVAKHEDGVIRAFEHYPAIARKHGMPVIMSNSVGYYDNFESAGTSAVWNKNGEVLAKMDRQREGILLFDTRSELVTELYFDS